MGMVGKEEGFSFCQQFVRGMIFGVAAFSEVQGTKPRRELNGPMTSYFSSNRRPTESI